jgi:UbiD family decarboxylase
MPLNNLKEFVELLDRHKQLIRVRQPVSAELEITEITDRVSKLPEQMNKGLLFEQVTGSDIPVLINAFGSAQRMAWALGVSDLEELNQKLGRLIDPRLPRGLGEALGRGKDLLGALNGAGLRPRKVRRAPGAGSGGNRKFLTRLPADPEMLAKRRRPLHHPAAGDHSQSRNQACAMWACTGCR